MNAEIEYQKFIDKINNEVAEIKEEIEATSNELKDKYPNSNVLTHFVISTISEKRNDFIKTNILVYGIPNLVGTKYNEIASTFLNKCVYEVLDYPKVYADSLYE